MDRTVDATAAEQGRVGRVDDGVSAQRRDVGDDHFQPRRTQLARSQAQNKSSGGGSRADRHALVGKELLQFAGLEHLADDVAAADEFALDVELRNGRPIGVGLDAVPQVGGLKDIEPLVADADVIENLHHLPGEAALRKLRRSLHEQHDVVRLHFVVNELLDAHIRFLLGRACAWRPCG